MSTLLATQPIGGVVKTAISADGNIITSGDIYARAFRSAGGVLFLQVEEIQNGMLMHLALGEGETSKTFFINDFAEMTAIMTAQIAARKIGV